MGRFSVKKSGNCCLIKLTIIVKIIKQLLTALHLACVQTSPPPQEKSGDPLLIFPKGGGTSVHRLHYILPLKVDAYIKSDH